MMGRDPRRHLERSEWHRRSGPRHQQLLQPQFREAAAIRRPSPRHGGCQVFVL